MINFIKNLFKCREQQCNIPVVSHSYFHSVIKKLPHSEGRVPYTYHHDYLRMNVEKFKGKSRSEVASNHSENKIELYAVALTKLLDELNFRDTMDLNSEDIVACSVAIPCNSAGLVFPLA